ncbi:MAG: hypothetical protein QOC89_885 [Paraburkholderia sp.]|jgi:hypothetical protein|nr:hypothetical protein [Paraburkholderia sp.]
MPERAPEYWIMERFTKQSFSLRVGRYMQKECTKIREIVTS